MHASHYWALQFFSTSMLWYHCVTSPKGGIQSGNRQPLRGTLQRGLAFQRAIVVSKRQIRGSSPSDWRQMTFVLATVKDIPQRGSLQKYTGAGCKALEVNPCWLESTYTTNTSTIACRLFWAAARCKAENMLVTIFLFGVQSTARTHAQVLPGSEKLSECAIIGHPCSSLNTSIHLPEGVSGRLSHSPATFPPRESDRKLRYKFHICYEVTALLKKYFFSFLNQRPPQPFFFFLMCPTALSDLLWAISMFPYCCL